MTQRLRVLSLPLFISELTLRRDSSKRQLGLHLGSLLRATNIVCFPVHPNLCVYDSVQIQELLAELPFPAHFCGIPSEFVELRAVVKIPALNQGLTREEGTLLQLLVELIFETHVGTEYLKTSLTTAAENDVVDHETFSQMLLSHLVSTAWLRASHSKEMFTIQ